MKLRKQALYCPLRHSSADLHILVALAPKGFAVSQWQLSCD